MKVLQLEEKQIEEKVDKFGFDEKLENPYAGFQKVIRFPHHKAFLAPKQNHNHELPCELVDINLSIS